MVVGPLLQRRCGGGCRGAPSRPGSGPGGSARPRRPGRRTSAGCSRGRVAIWARDSTWNTPTESARREHRVDLGVGLGCSSCSSTCSPWCSATRSIIRCSAVSMPSPSRSNLTSPADAQSSLSHCTTRAVLHPGPLHRHHLRHRPVADHHAAGVDAQVPGEAQQLVGQVDDLLGHRRRAAAPSASAVPALDPLAPRVLLAGREPERLGDVAHRRARPVGDHVGHLGGAAAPVAAVDVLDHLLAAAGLDVQVDVRVAVAGRGQEPLEQQAVAHGVDVGDAQRVADRGVRGRAPALAEDVRRGGRTRRCRARSGSSRGSSSASMIASSRSTVCTAAGYSAWLP